MMQTCKDLRKVLLRILQLDTTHIIRVCVQLKKGATRNRSHSIDFCNLLGGRLALSINSSFQIRPFHDAVFEASLKGWRGPDSIQTSCHVRAQQMSFFASALKLCKNLTQLVIGNASIGNQDTQILASALPSCTKLAHLDLCYNAIGGVGVAAIASALPSCPSLETLNLDYNLIDSAAAASLCAALLKSPSLRRLHLAGNPVGARAVSRIRRAAPGVVVVA